MQVNITSNYVVGGQSVSQAPSPVGSQIANQQTFISYDDTVTLSEASKAKLASEQNARTQGNGSGNEPPTSSSEPMGNGSGNEPPLPSAKSFGNGSGNEPPLPTKL